MLAVLQNGQRIGQFHHLVQPVGNVDHGDAALFHVPDQGEELFDFHLGQCGGGFVEDDDLGVLVQQRRDLHHLLGTEAQRTHIRFFVDVGQAAGIQDLPGGTVKGFVVDVSAAGRDGAGEQVAGHVQVQEVGKFLVHHADTSVFGLFRAFEVNFLAEQLHMPAVTALDTG